MINLTSFLYLLFENSSISFPLLRASRRALAIGLEVSLKQGGSRYKCIEWFTEHRGFLEVEESNPIINSMVLHLSVGLKCFCVIPESWSYYGAAMTFVRIAGEETFDCLL